MIKEESSGDSDVTDIQGSTHNLNPDIWTGRNSIKAITKVDLRTRRIQEEAGFSHRQPQVVSQVSNDPGIGNPDAHSLRIDDQSSRCGSHHDDVIGSVIQSETEVGDEKASDLFTARQSEFLDHNEVSFNAL